MTRRRLSARVGALVLSAGVVHLTAAATGCAAKTAPAVEAPVIPIAPAASSPRQPVVDSERALEPAAPVPLPVAFRAQLAALAAGIDGEDGTLFRRGHEREVANDLSGARKAYLELIMKAPDSPLVPYAYLAFGDFFFSDAESGEPDKWPLAQQSYQQVVKYPPPGNVAYAYAWQRLAASFNNAKDFEHALSAAQKSVTAVAKMTELPLRRETAAAAHRELVVAYAAAGHPDKAPAFFRSIDPASAAALILALGEEYARRGSAPQAIALYGTALRAARSPELCASAENARSLLR